MARKDSFELLKMTDEDGNDEQGKGKKKCVLGGRRGGEAIGR